MQTIGIVSEYNPFHNGHAYQIREAKRRTGADFVCVIMSPDFVQRGTFAVTDKYTRAEMALRGGADLVLELPVRFACASAADFAGGAVGILDALGCIDDLAFGCEAQQPLVLSKAASVLAKEPDDYARSLKKVLKCGAGFAASRESALKSFAENTGDAELVSFIETAQLHMPNNILAIEYLTAIRKLQSSMNPLPIRRVHTGYHEKLSLSESDSSGFASAEGIRAILLGSAEKGMQLQDVLNPCASYIPPECMPPFSDALQAAGFPSGVFYSRLLHFRLLEETDYSGLADVSPELSARIRNHLNEYEDAETFSASLQTRVFPKTHVDRALLHILLSLPKEERPENRLPSPEYVRILGFRRSAASLLQKMQEGSAIPLITRPAAAKKILSGPAIRHFEEDLHASHVYQLLFGDTIRHDMTRTPVMIG